MIASIRARIDRQFVDEFNQTPIVNVWRLIDALFHSTTKSDDVKQMI